MGKITLKALAERLGVSVSAISLALNSKPGLSDETRDRILNEVEKAGYQVRKSSAPSTRILLLFCKPPVTSLLNGPHQTDYIFMDLQRGILNLASQENCVTTIQYWDIGSPLNFEALQDCEGILLFNAPLLSPDQLNELLSLHIPVVLVDHTLPGQQVYSVSIDNEGGVIQGLDWLYECGCRRPVFVESEFDPMYQNERERRDAFLRWMKEKELTPAWLYLPTNREFESFREQLESADELPDAFFFSSDYLAFSLLPLLTETEIYKDKFPRIIGFDNLVGRFPSPYTFSSIDINSETRGREALRLLLRQIRERNCPYCHIRIATQLVVHGEMNSPTSKALPSM